MPYTPPIKSMKYLLHHAVDFDAVLACPDHSDTTADLVGDILDGAGRFASDVLAPTNWAGDQTPAALSGDAVTTSPGFKDAYSAYVEAGWQGLGMAVDHGGMGLPQAVSVATGEMTYAANMAFGLCPMLTASAMKAIAAHASDDLKAKYLPKMVTGEWSGAMNLTEPQAGSDLGPVRTKAVDKGDGTYAISGQKIYITWGEHDCADNIVHLVLARLPDAPEGSKGISLFLCPKYFVGDDGALGERNSLKCIGLEHKLGIHGSPTCTMEFDGATGWLIGEPNRGLACMFTMMNEARLFVGVQGVAIGDRAYQAALGFARERVQGRTLGKQETIIGHPDVRRMLMDMKARLMGARVICMATAVAGDIAASHPHEETRKAAHIREALLTPIAKSYGSDVGISATSTAVQVHGGMGFVEETGAAQHYRDSRIASIYEGTNGIQAIDLLARKIRRDGGAGMMALIEELSQIPALLVMTTAETGVRLGSSRDALEQSLATLREATQIMLDIDEADGLGGASNYLMLCGHIIAGCLLIKGMCNGLLAGDPQAENMQKLVWYHALVVMPEAGAHLNYLRRAGRVLFDYPEIALGDL
ncbi:acyl-CoA dehydrogenase family protein [Robiginitomaculum antarcticum]|uniref:acyl-CoA dehydrogenase family protein n=1 Tax=Robiginitomaculum antarcticum TaxID=437507 RepID=UPI0012E9C089|nr:acyl-CoA dehydrogenase family protein [Robiginitomaculum antarcticum]